MSNQNNTRKSRVTKHDVLTTFLLSGVDDVMAMLEGHSNPGKCIDDAVELIQQKNSKADVSELQQLRETFRSSGAGRGAVGLASAGEKLYIAQQVKDGVPFIRLPLDALGVQKGQKVRARLAADGTIEVRVLGA